MPPPQNLVKILTSFIADYVGAKRTVCTEKIVERKRSNFYLFSCSSEAELPKAVISS
jgi:hypothetical protein